LLWFCFVLVVAVAVIRPLEYGTRVLVPVKVVRFVIILQQPLEMIQI
jgi:hypothetical protein